MRPFFFILIGTALASCVPSVQFSEPMPPKRVNLPNIPRAFRGTIQDEVGAWQIGKDTVSMGDTVLVNGVDFLLRKMAGSLIVNLPVPETGNYAVVVIQNDGVEMTAHTFEESPAFLGVADSILSVSRVTKQTEGTFGWEYHLLAPTAAEFGLLIEQGEMAHDGWPCPLPNGAVVTPSKKRPPTN